MRVRVVLASSLIVVSSGTAGNTHARVDQCGLDDSDRVEASSLIKVRSEISRHAGKCKEKAYRQESVSHGDLSVKHYCEQKVDRDGVFLWDLIDAPLPQVKNRTAHALPSWNVEWVNPHEDFARVNTSFGKSAWWWPANFPADGELDRVLFLHGCHSECDVTAYYYSALADRLAFHMQMPVLGANYATQPEHPWPHNVKSVVNVIDHISKHAPSGPLPLRNLFIVADSDGTLVALHTAIALVDPSMSTFMGIPLALRCGDGAEQGGFPLAGLILFSPTVDVTCSGESMHTNCWDGQTSASHDGGPQPQARPESIFSLGQTDINRKGYCLPSRAEAIADCKLAYLKYFFGIELGTHIEISDAEREYEARGDFWTSPEINPLKFDFSVRGMPPVLVISGGADYWASDGITLVEHICESGGEVEQFLALGMWHDFVEYSDGCGNPDSKPLREGIEAYKRVGSFAKRIVERRPSPII